MPQAAARIQQAAQRQQSLVLDSNVYIRVNVVAQGENQENHLIGTGTKVTGKVKGQRSDCRGFRLAPQSSEGLRVPWLKPSPDLLAIRPALHVLSGMLVPHPSLELYDHVPCRAAADVGQIVRIAAGQPLDVSGFHVSCEWALAFPFAAKIKIGDGDN